MDAPINSVGDPSNSGANHGFIINQEAHQLPNNAAPQAANMDPKRLRRMQLNRAYAQRCRHKKKEYLEQLHAVSNAEEARVSMLYPQVSFFQSQVEMLQRENAALKQKLQEMEAQASLEEAKLSELKQEKERLQKLHMMMQHLQL